MAFFKDFFSRSSRVVKGQLNKSMDAMEDVTFEATLNQTVRDMKTELNNVIKASAEALSNTNRLEAEHSKYVSQSEDWLKKAKKALTAGDEGLAKKALAKKAECDTQVESMAPSVEKAKTTSAQLKRQVGDLKRKISEGERNAGTLIARKNAAKAQKKVSQALAGVGAADNAFSSLKQFEETVDREEAMAKAYDTMSIDEDTELAKEFEKLDVSSVDADLETLKKEMG
jgi:phage shock protein A